MARTVADANLTTRSARLKLPARREPHWRTLSEGLAIGYRKGARGGTWIARHYAADAGRRFKALGTADDIVDADGVHVLSFSQAQAAARTWFAELAATDKAIAETAQAKSVFTVADALRSYLAWYRLHRKSAERVEYIVDGFILPELGMIDCAELTARRIRDWHEKIAASPPRVRSKAGETVKHRSMPDTPEAKAARRSTANRILNVLKAALSRAYRENDIATDEAWRRVQPFRKVDTAKVQYLSDEECRRLVEACAIDFRPMVQAALLTGARFGELAALVAADVNPTNGTLHIRRAKSGKGRHIVLSDEGTAFFNGLADGRSGADRLFTTSSSTSWAEANHSRPLKRACAAAGIVPAISFHVLRHTYASRLAMQRVPLQVIAEQLGHADTRITQKHYAHLSQSYVADVIRAASPALGIATILQSTGG
jgi:integrase